MLKSFINQFRKIDEKIFIIMKYGFFISLASSMLAVYILLNYSYNPISIDTYYLGIQLFKTSLSFAIEFIICGFAFDIISKNKF